MDKKPENGKKSPKLKLLYLEYAWGFGAPGVKKTKGATGGQTKVNIMESWPTWISAGGHGGTSNY